MTSDASGRSRSHGVDAPVVVQKSIEVIAAATEDNVSTLRLVGASVAARSDMSVDDLDSVRLVVSELFSAFVRARHGAPTITRFDPDDPTPTISMSWVGDEAEIRLDAIGAALVAACTDSVRIDSGRATVIIDRRSSPESGAPS